MRKIDTQNFQRATRDTPREINRTIILNIMRERGPISRADLARTMGLPRGMITSLVNELLAEGLVSEGATAQAPRGRKPTLLHLRSHDRLAIGIDLLASRTAIRLSDFGGQKLAEQSFATPDGPEDLVARLAECVRELLASRSRASQCEGIGLVVPGMVDGRNGIVLNLPTLGWRNVDLRGALASVAKIPVHIERDAVACALAHMWLGPSPDDMRDFVYMIVSDGVGAGIMINGQPVRGCNYTAGEFGHVPVALDGPLCSCGKRGCLESYTSDPATIARYLERTFAGRDTTSAMRSSEIRVADLVRLAKGGDTRAREALTATGRYLGVGLASIINALNPACIILGGEIVAAWDLLEPVLRTSIEARTLTESAAATTVALDPDHAETRLLGATALFVAPAFAAPRIA